MNKHLLWILSLIVCLPLSYLIGQDDIDGPYRFGEVCGMVFEDHNGDGFSGSGEFGIANIDVLIQYPVGNTLLTLTSDFLGYFNLSFSDEPGLNLGSYPVLYLTVDLPAGWIQTSNDGNPREVFPQDWYVCGLYIGIYNTVIPQPPVQGAVIEDVNLDGVADDDEPGIPGVVINLLEPVQNHPVAATITDDQGSYSFEVIPRNPLNCSTPSPSGDPFDLCYIAVITEYSVCCSWWGDPYCQGPYEECLAEQERSGSVDFNILISSGAERTDYTELFVSQDVPDGMIQVLPQTPDYCIWVGQDLICDFLDAPEMDTGACCSVVLGCQDLSEEECAAIFGNWLPDEVCGNDLDEDSIDDLCDPDIDGDGILNEFDNCPFNYNTGQEDQDNDGIGNLCDETPCENVCSPDEESYCSGNSMMVCDWVDDFCWAWAVGTNCETYGQSCVSGAPPFPMCDSVCGDGLVAENEACDDGNLINGDGCNDECLLEFCGNGVLDEGEACDDGNFQNNDGCSNECQIETGACCWYPLWPGTSLNECTNETNDFCASLNGEFLGYGSECDSSDDDADFQAATCDNCPFVFNQDQEDTDEDGFGNVCDNCPTVSNPYQWDDDFDGIGNACDCGNGQVDPGEACDDGNLDNGDGCSEICLWELGACCATVIGTVYCSHTTESDCSSINGDFHGYNTVCDQNNDDEDSIVNTCDNCPDVQNQEQEDLDGDGVGDACDPDLDGDGYPNEADNCPHVDNLDQYDTDEDGWGDACDNCPTMPNPFQEDSNGNGIGDVCDWLSDECTEGQTACVENVLYNCEWYDPGQYWYWVEQVNCADFNQSCVDQFGAECMVVCGDGMTAEPETCDDGNLLPGDGCSATCSLEGDINGDGALNVVDIVQMVGLILENAPYALENDPNMDGMINVVDIVLLVCWITDCDN